MTTLTRLDKGQLGKRLPVGDGGQGTVYLLPDLKFAAGGKPIRLVFKEYSASARNALDEAVLEDLAALRDAIDASDRARLVSRTAFPIHLVTEHGSVAGFTMVEIPRQFYRDMTFLGGIQRTLGEVQHLLQSEKLLAERTLAITDRLRLEFLLDVAMTLEFFHRHGLVVGDLSAKNLLFRLSGKSRCFFLDCDSMVLRGRSALELMETPEWGVPKGEQPGTVAADLYKFGLLAIRLFAGDQSERDPRRASHLNGTLQRLAASDLQLDPGFRAPAGDWIRPLEKAIRGAATTPHVTAAAPGVTVTSPHVTGPQPAQCAAPPLLPIMPTLGTQPLQPAVRKKPRSLAPARTGLRTWSLASRRMRRHAVGPFLGIGHVALVLVVAAGFLWNSTWGPKVILWAYQSSIALRVVSWYSSRAFQSVASWAGDLPFGNHVQAFWALLIGCLSVRLFQWIPGWIALPVSAAAFVYGLLAMVASATFLISYLPAAIIGLIGSSILVATATRHR